jgi:hypothetical protein
MRGGIVEHDDIAGAQRGDHRTGGLPSYGFCVALRINPNVVLIAVAAVVLIGSIAVLMMKPKGKKR